MTTIVDTDAIFAISNPADALHKRAKQVVERLDNAAIILSPTTIAEFSLTAPREMGLLWTKQVVHDLTHGHMRIETVSEADVQTATQLFYQQKKVQNSLCDCFVMALAKRIRADCIFSFDRWYKQNGFVLIEDSFEQMSAK